MVHSILSKITTFRLIRHCDVTSSLYSFNLITCSSIAWRKINLFYILTGLLNSDWNGWFLSVHFIMVQLRFSNVFRRVIPSGRALLRGRNNWRVHGGNQAVRIITFTSLIIFSAIWWMIVATSAVFVGLLLFESFPLKLIVTGLFSNLVYLGEILPFSSHNSVLGLLRSFPMIDLSSPNFILSLIMLTINHIFAFNYFGEVRIFPWDTVFTEYFLGLLPIPRCVELFHNMRLACAFHLLHFTLGGWEYAAHAIWRPIRRCLIALYESGKETTLRITQSAWIRPGGDFAFTGQTLLDKNAQSSICIRSSLVTMLILM